MRTLRYLAACLVAGLPLGWMFGEFARARFHYPPRREAVAWWHQALLEALDVVEWPAFFALALAVALGLWAWFDRQGGRGRRSRGGRSAVVAAGLLALTGALLGASGSAGHGRPLAALAGALMGALLAVLLRVLWSEAAVAAPRTILARWAAQLPPTGGQLLVTSVASMSLGYRGESALFHGIALLIGFALFAAEQVVALAIAVLVGRRAPGR